jgi:uncharacterized integral membrane protein
VIVLRRFALAFTVLLLFALAVIFAALNRQHFDVDFAFVKFDVSSGLALIIAFAAGVLGGAVWRSSWIARLLAERGRLRHALRRAEARRPAPAPGDAPADAG